MEEGLILNRKLLYPIESNCPRSLLKASLLWPGMLCPGSPLFSPAKKEFKDAMENFPFSIKGI